MKLSLYRHIRFALLFSFAAILGLVVSYATGTAEAAEAQKAAPAKSEKGATTETKKPTVDPTDPASVIYLDTSGKPAGIGDPDKPAGVAYKQGRGWHPQAIAGATLPKDKYGLIDWAKLVREKLIKPKFSFDPTEEEMPPLKLDILIPAKGDFVDDVIYPHEMHTFWLKCEVCHPNIFIPAKGQNDMSMVGIVQGQWCGRCHGKIAFPLSDCKRCHVSPKKAEK
ncbi:MAG: c(7)-type cytochrome triheme domain-containing protein [Deltaproteobacteria bacterium]